MLCLFIDSSYGVYSHKQPRTGDETASAIHPLFILRLLTISKHAVQIDNWLNYISCISLPSPLGYTWGLAVDLITSPPVLPVQCCSGCCRDDSCAAALILFAYPFSCLTPSPSNGGSVSERMNQNFNEVKHAAKTGILRILTPLETFCLFKSNFLPFLQ